MPVIKFISDKPRQYALYNHLIREFTPGEFYEVPPSVADGMIKRKWAQLATAEDLAQPTPVDTDKTVDPTPGDEVQKEGIGRRRASRLAADEAAKEAEANAEAEKKAEDEKKAADAKALEEATEAAAAKGRRTKET